MRLLVFAFCLEMAFGYFVLSIFDGFHGTSPIISALHSLTFAVFVIAGIVSAPRKSSGQ